MLEDYPISPALRERLCLGRTAPHLDDFAQWLHQAGFRPRCIVARLSSLAPWCQWLGQSGLELEAATSALPEYGQALQRAGLRHDPSGRRHRSFLAAKWFLRFLEERGVVSRPASLPPAHATWPLLGEYRSWMRLHRGVTESTLDVYQRILLDLRGALGEAPELYSAGAVRQFVLERARPHGYWQGRSIVTAVRSFLRFLGVTARCPVGWEHALPSFAAWRLSSLPRYLEQDQVDRVVAACPATLAHGRRDRAVLLLLARLGLRASEVAQLEVSAIDWAGGRISLSGKGRRAVWLPLPQEVGDAILDYLRGGRPPLRSSRVFTTVVAPYRPLTRYVVTSIVRRALRCAGVRAPVNGAHVLRHSVATGLLRQGASLATVGAVLRHRNPNTTALYAKVDFGLLGEVAQPWPGVRS